MKLEEINNKTNEALSFLVEALESGESEVLTQYLNAMARFHTYSFGNIMLIARQRPTATRVAGIRTWNSLGRFVKRGEKGILILAPMVGRRSQRKDEIATEIESNNDAEERKPEQQLYGFRAVYVFDVSQTEGKELPTLTDVEGDVTGYRERLIEYVESQNITLRYSEKIAPAKGLSSGGRITLLTGMQPADEFSTLAHEMAHEMLHHSERRALHLKFECLDQHPISSQDRLKADILDGVKRWFYNDWRRIDNKLRTSIVEGISVFLSLFDDSPMVKRTFCPPKECYDPKLNTDGKYGRPLPPFSELIEAGKVCALNFPVSLNPGLAKAIGVMMKLDFQRAMLNRIPKIEHNPGQHFRQAFFICDEYQHFATVGESDPNGDEKFFALSRQSKCIPIVATQSISSLRSSLPGETWRTLLQTFRTKIFLALSDEFSAKIASELCGKETSGRSITTSPKVVTIRA